MYTRILPCLDARWGKLIKGVHFKNVREVGDQAEFFRRCRNHGEKAPGYDDASLFHFGVCTVADIKSYLRGQGIPVRF